MRKKNSRRTDQQAAPAQNERQKPLLLIRPRSFSLEMDNLFFLRRLSPARTPTFRSSLRIVLNLFGVLVVIAATGFLLWQASINAYSGLVITKAPVPLKCKDIKHCAEPLVSASSSTATLASQATQTPSPAAQVTLMPTFTPTVRPTQTPKPTPDPTLPPTVTPVGAYLKVAPTRLTLSLVANCVKGRPVILLLTDAGGTPLVWFRDSATSSRGISIADPTKTHLLQPGTSVNATVNCLATLVVGLYTLAIDYNGGAVSIAVKITL